MKKTLPWIKIVDETDLYILPGRNPHSRYLDIYAKTYHCWKEIWSDTFRNEMNVNEVLFSDSFTRQDEILALFHQSKCVGLASIRYINPSYPGSIDDSYFRSWPYPLIQKIKMENSIIATASHFTIHRKYRGSKQIIHWKKLLISLFIENFKRSSSKIQIMVAAARRIKSNEKNCYNSGAVPLAVNLNYHIPGEKFDLVSWEKNCEGDYDENIKNLSKKIWNHVIRVPRVGIEETYILMEEKVMNFNYRQYCDTMIEKLKNFPWDSKKFYADYLAQTYYYVCHSTRLLACSAGRMNQEDQKMHRRFLEHSSEEVAHELMAKKDLQSLGYKIEDFPEKAETRMFWEPQYYKIEYVDPSALMGYILVLEDVASRICPWINKEVEKSYGKKAATFIRVHGEDDPEHVEQAIKVIESLPLHRRKHIFENIIQTTKSYNLMIDEILKDCEKSELKQAA